jgi:hypothetical protein
MTRRALPRRALGANLRRTTPSRMMACVADCGTDLRGLFAHLWLLLGRRMGGRRRRVRVGRQGPRFPLRFVSRGSLVKSTPADFACETGRPARQRRLPFKIPSRRRLRRWRSGSRRRRRSQGRPHLRSGSPSAPLRLSSSTSITATHILPPSSPRRTSSASSAKRMRPTPTRSVKSRTSTSPSRRKTCLPTSCRHLDLLCLPRSIPVLISPYKLSTFLPHLDRPLYRGSAWPLLVTLLE